MHTAPTESHALLIHVLEYIWNMDEKGLLVYTPHSLECYCYDSR